MALLMQPGEFLDAAEATLAESRGKRVRCTAGPGNLRTVPLRVPPERGRDAGGLRPITGPAGTVRPTGQGRVLPDRQRWPVASPEARRHLDPGGVSLEETEDECIEMHDAIDEATGYYGFVVDVLVFSTWYATSRWSGGSQPQPSARHLGLDTLHEDLERIAERVGFFYPPKAMHSENECRNVNQLQYRGTQGRRSAGIRPQPTVRQRHRLNCRRRALSKSIIIHIQRVDRLEVHHHPCGRGRRRTARTGRRVGCSRRAATRAIRGIEHPRHTQHLATPAVVTGER